MEKIKNQYKGKTPEQVWNLWDEKQRSHFLLDHSELLDNDRVENFGDVSGRTVQKDKKYSELTPHTKRVLDAHVKSGQYAKGGVADDVQLSISKEGDKIKYKGSYKDITFEGEGVFESHDGAYNKIKQEFEAKGHKMDYPSLMIIRAKLIQGFKDVGIDFKKGGNVGYKRFKDGIKVKVDEAYIQDEASGGNATETATVMSEPSDEEELVMIQYENGLIDYLGQEWLEPIGTMATGGGVEYWKKTITDIKGGEIVPVDGTELAVKYNKEIKWKHINDKGKVLGYYTDAMLNLDESGIKKSSAVSMAKGGKVSLDELEKEYKELEKKRQDSFEVQNKILKKFEKQNPSLKGYSQMSLEAYLSGLYDRDDVKPDLELRKEWNKQYEIRKEIVPHLLRVENKLEKLEYFDDKMAEGGVIRMDNIMKVLNTKFSFKQLFQ